MKHLSVEQKWINIMVNSVSQNLTAFVVLFIVHRFTTAILSLIYHIPTVIYTNRTEFLALPELWTYDSVKVIFASGIIATLVICIVLLVIFIRTIEHDGLIRLFFLWGILIGISQIFGSIILGAFLYEGTGYIYGWLYLTETTKMLLLFGGILILLIIGTLLSRPMLFTANSYFNFLVPEQRKTFIKWQFIIPFAISVVIMYLLRIPLSLYESLLLLAPVIVLLPLYWAPERYTVIYFEEGHKPHTISYFLLFSTIAILILFEIAFSIGIRIY